MSGKPRDPVDPGVSLSSIPLPTAVLPLDGKGIPAERVCDIADCLPSRHSKHIRADVDFAEAVGPRITYGYPGTRYPVHIETPNKK